jgi:NHL repeat
MKTVLGRAATAVLVTLGLMALASAPAWAGNGYETASGSFGEPCSSSPCDDGQFNGPTGIAVNDETGDVYVVDTGDGRVEWFNSTGSSFEGQFDGSGSFEVKGKKETGTASPTGKLLEPEGIAVDNDPASPSHGDIYVADVGHDVVDEFSATGAYEGQIRGGKCENEGEMPPCSGSTLVPFSGQLNVATDSSGNLWIYEWATSRVYEFDDTGAFVETFELPGRGTALTTPAFAVDSSDDIYVTGGGDSVYEYVRGTLERIELGSEQATESATLAVIAATGRLLVDEGSKIELFGSPFREFPSEGLSESAGIAVNGANGEGTVFASQSGASTDNVVFFVAGATEKPEIVSESAATGQAGAADGELSAVINPNNSETTYLFEYATTAGAVENDEGTQLPGAAPLPAEFGEQTVTVSAQLEPTSETFYYRVIATNAIETVNGGVQSYTKLPLISAGSIVELTSTSATVEVTINPLFAPTKYRFEYAPSKTLLEEGKGIVIHGNNPILNGGQPSPCPETEVSGGTGDIVEEINKRCPVGAEISGLLPGHTYYYRVVAENSVTKRTKNENKGEPIRGPPEPVRPHGAPIAATGEAGTITPISATLSGEINPEGVKTSYYFAYIGEADYNTAIKEGAANPYAAGGATATLTLPAGEATQAVGPLQASDLTPGTTYHYALVATNQFGIQTIGPDRTLTTQPSTPPSAITGTASAVTETTATVTATISTNGLVTSYGFEIGTVAGSYGPATGLGSIGGVATEQPVSVALTGLHPGTTYHYRIKAANVDGIIYGEDKSFTTVGLPSLLPIPGSPQNLAFTTPKPEPEPIVHTKLTTKQRLEKALKACRRDKMKSNRVRCEKSARSKYKAHLKKHTKKH